MERDLPILIFLPYRLIKNCYRFLGPVEDSGFHCKQLEEGNALAVLEVASSNADGAPAYVK
jgi:hypothetical protein